MSVQNKTFSESWYRIADRHVALAPHVEVKRQVLRGERNYLLRNPYSNTFFRLRPAAWDFVARLRRDRTVHEVWKECLENDPEAAPGQEAALKLLAQLHAAHLLQSDLPPDTVQTFERYRQRRNKELKSMATNVLFARIPLLNPDRWLRSLLPALKWVVSPWGLLAWLLLMGVATKALVDHWRDFQAQTAGLLSPGNLPWLFASLFVLKLVHEFGHAAVCRRFGGEVPTLGVMLMLMTPVPYVDTTSSYAFRSRWQRVAVGLAGMWAESFVAATAALIWANTSEGALHAVSYNVMIVASVATIFFNINPLLRFDGYYILADYLEIPNLQMRSIQQLKYFAERYLFGIKSARPPLATRGEAIWLSVYGVASQVYRIVLSFSILLYLATRYLLLGQVLAIFGFLLWILVPLGKLGLYVFSAPQLEHTRTRAYAVCATALLLGWTVLQWIPAPRHVVAPGILQSEHDSAITVRAPGQVVEVLAISGTTVKAGDPIVRLVNGELNWEIKGAEAELNEAIAHRVRAQEQDLSDLEPINSRISALERQLAKLRDDAVNLLIRSPHDGVWISPEAYQIVGTWLPRGMEIGRVIDTRRFQFSAVISQEEASNLFGGEIKKAAVRLRGEAGKELTVKSIQAIPAEQERLPSAALGWAGGGEIATAATDAEGMTVREPFFEVRTTVEGPADLDLLHGCSGKIRFDLPSEPLLTQWVRKLRQLLQRRGIG